MGKVRLFIENFLVYGLGGIISNVVPVIMLPIVTRLMPNSTYFGVNDMSSTIVSFASALAILGMYDAMYRMFFEKEGIEYKKKVCSTTFMFNLFMSFIVFIFIIVFRNEISKMFFGDIYYANILYITAIATLVGATNSIIAAPTRMQNKRKIFLVTNTVSPILSYGISIPMLLSGHYLIALPLAATTASLIMEVTFWILNKEWFSLRRFDVKILNQLLRIGVPLLPNFLIYWIFNSSDKVMVTNILNIGEAGIYSVGAKLGMASQLIYTAFAGGWQYFAFSTMKEENQVQSNSKIFEYLGIISYVATAFVCAWSYTIYDVVFTDEYLSGYLIAPYLFLAPLLQMLFQVAANQFLVIKKTWPNMLILLLGAILNVIMNILLIPVLGIEGAAIATLLGYVLADVICCIVLSKMKLMVLRTKFMIGSILMFAYFIVWRRFFLQRVFVATFAAIAFTGIILLIYSRDINEAVSSRSRK